MRRLFGGRSLTSSRNGRLGDDDDEPHSGFGAGSAVSSLAGTGTHAKSPAASKLANATSISSDQYFGGGGGVQGGGGGGQVSSSKFANSTSISSDQFFGAGGGGGGQQEPESVRPPDQLRNATSLSSDQYFGSPAAALHAEAAGPRGGVQPNGHDMGLEQPPQEQRKHKKRSKEKKREGAR
mmetsp:Transcript_100396/g.323626  ORF Transcript_100396/g.323626 Transcript_100396/m.323626 type:complete len:181 (-) Transcript_100396:359-901(-)